MKLNKYKYIIIILLAAVCLPTHMNAAFITSSSGEVISSGDTSVISVFLDTEGAVINSIDGAIVLSDEHNGNFEVRDISLANSVMTMWPRKPSLEAGSKISFVGGIPGGVKGDHLLLFKAVVKINQDGRFTVKPTDVVFYLNDGLGTAVKAKNTTSIIQVEVAKVTRKDDWQTVVSKDNIAPLPFNITLHQDINLYDGKKFISFETTDVDSGINYYEVKEGNNDVVRSGTDYVLIDQLNKKNITVTAYDKAANFQVAVLQVENRIHWMSITVTLVILIIIYKIFKKIRIKNKNKLNEN